MKKTCCLFLMCLLNILAIQAQQQQVSFEYFHYKGDDAVYHQKIGKDAYYNPILAGCYPDPGICRKGDDYYLVNSSFSYYPGIPIFHSKDMINWKQIGYVLDKLSQLNLTGIRISGGIYAPAISYNPHNDTFYLITTCVDGIGNFIVKTKDPDLGWSDPIVLPKVGGIDPSLFFDDDGKAYIVHNDAPEGTPEWEGHRAIWMHEFDVNTDQTVGLSKIVIDGGVDKSKKPIWIEAPHLYKKDGYYYLMAAEGGTAENHSEVIFRSKDIWGKYIPSQVTPILTQRDLAENRENKITCAGHADILQDKNGQWWAVFLACRPYKDNFYNTGRETFLLPFEWKKDEFPVILPQGKEIPLIVNKKGVQYVPGQYSGNFEWKDEFNTPKLDLKWNFIRTPDKQFYRIENGKLIMNAENRSIKDVCNPAFLGIRQQHLIFEADTQLEFSPQNDNDLAGMVCFQNENYNFISGKTLIQGKQMIVLEKNTGKKEVLGTIPVPENLRQNPFSLKVKGMGGLCSFYVSFEKDKWLAIAENVDATNLSTQVAGGFTGTMIGMYATSAALWQPLKTVYKDYFPMGVAVSPNHLQGQEAAMIKTHFNSITAENAMKPENLLKKEGGYNWWQADQIVSFARRNNLKMRGHTLVWHNQTPDWFFQDENGNDLDSTRLYQRLEKYMTDVMTHFKDDIYCWDVVNEAISDKNGEMYRTEKSGWYRICKEDFIAKAFRLAKKINPDVKLFYNDYNMVNPQKREKAYQMLKSLLAQGVPIDGIGMQAHWSMQDLTAEAIQTSIDMFSSLGLEIHITELDLTIYPPYHGEGANNQPKEIQAFTLKLAKKQADLYQMIFDVFRKNQGKITSVTFWGLADNYTWLDDFPVKNRKDHPLIFGENLEPKESFYKIVNFE